MHTPVVVRNRWWLRLAGIPLVAVGVVCLTLAVTLPASTSLGTGAKVFLVPLMLLVGLTGVFGGAVAVLMKQTFSDTQVTMRKYVRTFVIDAGTASRIRQVRASVHTGRSQVPVGRLQVVGDESRTRMAPRAFIDETLTHAEEGMACLDEWVRRRPELVAGDPAARQVFVDRGALPSDVGQGSGGPSSPLA
ncbi:MAG: hypothetical protein ACXVW1_03820 [Nocardioides sp.]